jgi:predicted RNA-binding Zn-ribbon protein involved in translation (DUF1610 family)/uncharacterized small protein (DUF1192 family)
MGFVLEGETTMSSPSKANVNVTLKTDEFEGKVFPCPVCGAAHKIRIARTGKPYFHCDLCGIQLFFRGRSGITRLRELLKSGTLIAGNESRASAAIILYNRLQQLKADKRELEKKQGVFFRNEDLDNAIAAVQNEIEKVQAELKETARKNHRRA